MILIQSPRGIAVMAPGWFVELTSPDDVWALQRVAGVASPRQVSASDYDRMRALMAANPAVQVSPLAALLAGPVAAGVSEHIGTLTDATVERIRDAAVEALELSKGTLNTTTNVMRFSRVAQP